MKGTIAVYRNEDDRHEICQVFVSEETDPDEVVQQIVKSMNEAGIGAVCDLETIRQYEETHYVCVDFYAFDTDLYSEAIRLDM